MASQQGTPVVARAPLSGNYPASAAMALLGLAPFIVLTTAYTMMSTQIVGDLHTTTFWGDLSNALANAAYAFGAVLAADLILRIPQRWLFIGCELAYTAGSLLAGLSGGIAAFTVGRVLEGLTTGILLVVALPPLVTKYGARRFPTGALIINLGLFGMVTLGPVAGGIAAGWASWRLLFFAIAGLGLIGTGLGFAAYEHSEAPTPRVGFDVTAIPLALAGTFLPFFGVSWLERGGYTSAGFLIPFIAGLGLLGLLVGLQFAKDRALMPVRPISNTLPVFGIGMAMIAGGAFTVLLELTISYLLEVLKRPPATVAGLLAPMLAGVTVAAVLFKRMVRGRWLVLLVIGGTAAVAVAAALLLALSSWTADGLVPVAAALLGFGAGASVAPGLFMGGMSVPSAKLGPTFALVELLRSEAAFVLAPILSYVAISALPSQDASTHLAIGVVFGLLAIVSAGLLAVLAAGGIGPHAPDLVDWLEGEGTALHSPSLAEPLRDPGRNPESQRAADPAAHPAEYSE